MGREVRMVPVNWQHPKNERGSYKPLLGLSFNDSLTEWKLNNQKWSEGLREDYKGGWQPIGNVEAKTYEEWSGEKPVIEDYMPIFPEGTATHLMMYETCSEGTPISPSFATPEELAHWLTDNNASSFGDIGAPYEDWLRVCQGGYACSAVIVDGVMKSGVEGLS